MKISLIFILAFAASSQSLTLTSSTPTAKPGAQVMVTLSFTDSAPSANVAGIEWTLVLPNNAADGTPIGIVATKPMTCNGATCLMIGSGSTLNASPLASGPLATFPITIATGSQSGPLTVALSNVTATSVSGTSVSLNAPSLTLSVAAPLVGDLNGDGVVNAADVASAQSQALGFTPCTTGDVNGDGKCNVIDVQLVINAAQANGQ